MMLRILLAASTLILWAGVAAAQEKPRFIDKGEYVEDVQTGLWWQKDGQASGKKNFYDAAKYAAGLKLGGRTGWRVPTAKEFETIIPADKAPFTNSAYNPDQCCAGPKEFRSYWTSELDGPPEKDYAFVYHWYAKGGKNNCFASANLVYVRCVLDPKSAAPAGAAAAAPAAEKLITGEEAVQALELIAQLGSDDFARREAAVAGLKAFGRRILPLLTAALEKAQDAEVRFRLKKLIEEAGR